MMQNQLNEEEKAASPPFWQRAITHLIPAMELIYLFGGLLVTYLVYEVFGR